MQARTLAGLLLIAAAHQAHAVTHSTATIGGFAADVWTYTDKSGQPRTVAIKQEGNGNSGHGGYAIQFTYISAGSLITINAPSGSDGGFGYFVSHERYRHFAGGAVATIANRIFHTDDSPLGRNFAATITYPQTAPTLGAERVTIQYGHYGTITPDPVNPNTGNDSKPLPAGTANYAFYTIPATTTWVFQDGRDYPRIDISVSLANIPGPDLVSFDMRGPYGVMPFDNGADGIVNTVQWADRGYRFNVIKKPVTRNSTWSWSAANAGARFQTLQAGGFEMGLVEPAKIASTRTNDGYSAERGFTSASYAAAGGTSNSSCKGSPLQTLPSDGEWPYQSVQYSLPCGAGTSGTPTNGKKIAWGSTAFEGTSLTAVYNGQTSYPFNGFPANNTLAYSVCLILGKPASGSLAATAAAAFAKVTPASPCAVPAIP